MCDPVGLILFHRYYLHAIEQDEGADALDLAHEFCEGDHSNVMVLGWHGRPKAGEDPIFFGKEMGWLAKGYTRPVLIINEHIGR